MIIFGRWEIRRHTPPPVRAIPPLAVLGTGITDLHQALISAMYGVHPALRNFDSAWVLSPGWAEIVKQLARHLGQDTGPAVTRDGQVWYQPDGYPPQLLGRPAVVTPEGGWPHLEPQDLAATHPSAPPGWYPSPSRSPVQAP